MDEMQELYRRMRSGEPYKANEGLVKDYNRATAACIRFNNETDPQAWKSRIDDIFGREVDPSLQIIPPFKTDFGKFTEFGDDVFINSGAAFLDQGGIILGDHARLGPNVTLITTNHFKELEKRDWMINKPIVLEEHVWLGAGVTVLPGVTIGRGAIVGASAVVTKDVPPMTVSVGNPARVISRF